MENKEFAGKLEVRTREFGVSIIKLSVKLPDSAEGRVIKNQLTKSGTSVGANYREANRSRSKADFKNKISICASEANETLYWLEIISDMKWVRSQELETLVNECKELLALMTSIGKTLS
jgi:four helix bundle protein